MVRSIIKPSPIKPSKRLAMKLAVGEHARFEAEMEEAEAEWEEASREAWKEIDKLLPPARKAPKGFWDRLINGH